jgi:hypothetical protein
MNELAARKLTAAERIALYRQRHTIQAFAEGSVDGGGYIMYCVHDGIRIHATRSPRTIRAWRHDSQEIARLAAATVVTLA